MNLSDNIKNAFEVVIGTYENLNKFMQECDKVAGEQGYITLTPRFLRVKSDREYIGWLTTSFIKLYQRKDAPDCERDNGMKNDDIYGIEILLWENPNNPSHQVLKWSLPEVIISKFSYETFDDWESTPAVNEHWGFHYPLRGLKGYCNITKEKINDIDVYVSRATPKANETYWGLKHVIFTKQELIAINAANLKDKIFDEFEKLRLVEIA